MATRPLSTAEALPALEFLERADELGVERRRRAVAWARGALVLDAAMLAAAALASQLGARDAGVLRISLVWLLTYSGLVLLLLYLRGMYSWRVRLQVLDDLRTIVTTTALAGMILLTLRIILPGNVVGLAPQTLRLWAFTAFYLGAGRAALDWAQLKARAHRELEKPTLIVGAGRVGRLAATRLLDHPEFGLRPVGFLDKEPIDQPNLPVPVLGASWDLEHVIEQHGVEHVLVTFSTAPSEVLLREAKRCEELGVSVSLVPRLFEHVTERVSVEHIGGLPLISAKRIDPKGWQFAIKHGLDRLVALIALVPALPILGAGALAVWVSMGRPIFFRQRRAGRDGRTFEMLKLRSMKPSATNGALPEDDESERTTRVGELLRRTSIDELPQLLNVLRGDMSLVGPRPERPELVTLFDEYVHRYDDRLRVKAGITGWAQVHGLGRGSDRFARSSLAERIEWDNYYIENWSLWLDVKIVLMTLTAVLRSLRQGV
jgi:exopolysaccharide biosynthesis polyprenyl glycosylphosphotransferase